MQRKEGAPARSQRPQDYVPTSYLPHGISLRSTCRLGGARAPLLLLFDLSKHNRNWASVGSDLSQSYATLRIDSIEFYDCLCERWKLNDYWHISGNWTPDGTGKECATHSATHAFTVRQRRRIAHECDTTNRHAVRWSNLLYIRVYPRVIFLFVINSPSYLGNSAGSTESLQNISRHSTDPSVKNCPLTLKQIPPSLPCSPQNINPDPSANPRRGKGSRTR